MIDLRSDTVTRPTSEMLEAMMNATVGDDVFGEDPTINFLEEKAAGMFGMEAGLFCPSGTMTNQIALRVHTQALDEVICDRLCHIYNYETGGYASSAGIGIQLLDGDRGRLSPESIIANIRADFDWLPKSRMVTIENTCNKAGGSFYTLDQMKAISDCCRQHELKLHLDGARIFNALLASGNDTKDLHGLFDSISICISKGLGAPVGSLLLGSKGLVHSSRRFRKVMGGGMRQAGYLAAACIYALDHHVDRLVEDHQRAKRIENALLKLSYIEKVEPVDTNIVVFKLSDAFPLKKFLDHLKEQGILATSPGYQSVRLVTHLDIDDDDVDRTVKVLEILR